MSEAFSEALNCPLSLRTMLDLYLKNRAYHAIESGSGTSLYSVVLDVCAPVEAQEEDQNYINSVGIDIRPYLFEVRKIPE